MSDEGKDFEPNRPAERRGGGRPPLKPTPPGGGILFWFMMFGLLVFGVLMFVNTSRKTKQETITLSQFYERLGKGQIGQAEIRRNLIEGDYSKAFASGRAATSFSVRILDQEVENLSRALIEYNKEHPDSPVDYMQEPGNEFMNFFLLQVLPVLLILFGIWYLLARQMRSAGGAGSVLSFGKARARLHSKEKSDITFDHVAGIDEAKEEVQELVEFLQNPTKFRRLGGRIPRGVLLVGPPGCGKTLLAKAIAGEAEVPFFSISGSDFIEMFVGVGASRVRDLFRQAKESCPCIIFLDEIDAVGRRRAVDIHGASAESAQTLNAILVEMDGFETDDSIIVIAATNRPDVLDPALLRPGRFDRQVVVDLPDIRGREAILRVHARKYKLAAEVDLRQAARGTPLFSGADLEALLNEAAIIATRSSKKAVDMADIEEARDKVRWGRQRRSRAMTEEDRKITAYHESGHALVARMIPESEPLHKVSIIPQGMALGITMSLPERDRYHIQRKRILAQITILLAGRVAEELCCEDISSGAQSDFDQATDIARHMVCRWGMSDVIGPVSYHELEEPAFLGQGTVRPRICSEAVAVKIDEEISRIVRESYERAKGILSERLNDLERLMRNLLKYEVLYSDDVTKILAGEDIVREPQNGSSEARDSDAQSTETATA